MDWCTIGHQLDMKRRAWLSYRGKNADQWIRPGMRWDGMLVSRNICVCRSFNNSEFQENMEEFIVGVYGMVQW